MAKAFATLWADKTETTFQIKQVYVPAKGATVSGYGNALPTPYMVKFCGRWRRVKCARVGNAGTMYIGKPRAWVAVINDIERD